MADWGRYLRGAIRVAIRSSTIFRANLVSQLVGVVFTAFLLIAFWSTLFRDAASVEGISLSAMIVYAVGTVLLTIVLNLPIEEELATKIRSGDVALSVTRPIPYPATVFMDALGEVVARLLVRVTPYALVLGALAAALTGTNPLTTVSMPALLLAVVSAALAVALSSFYQMIFGTLAFWTAGQLYGLVVARRELARLTSGAFIPLWFFPEWGQHVAAYLPFQGLFHVPLSILIGKLEGAQAMRSLALQAMWIVVFFAIALAVWRRASRRIEIQGG